MREVALALAATLLALNLAGCGSFNDVSSTAAFVAPGKFQMYTCQDVETFAVSLRSRQIELEQLMARSAQSAGGEFINSVAYKSEYLQTRGELAELSRASADKQCASESPWSSGRAVF